MALIINKPIITISKEEMKKHVKEIEKNPDGGIESLSPEKKQIRKEVQDAKRHREFMGRVSKNEERDLANVVATSEIVSIAVGEAVKTSEQPSETPDVDFNSMTKKQIDEWAEENLGIQLDRRHTKAKLIEEIKENL